MAQADFIISGLMVHTEESILTNARVKIQASKFAEISASKKISDGNNFIFPANYQLIPGRIDIHIHGAAGADVMDSTSQALDRIRQSLAQEGVTGFLATTLSESPQRIEAALDNIGEYQQKLASMALGARILGVHLEGPFISPLHKGAHRQEFLLEPDKGLFDHWQSCAKGWIKLVTLAPELANGMEFIQHLRQHNVLASIGHSDADFRTTQQAIAAGATQATHLFNAMRCFHHREPGCVGAILLNDKVSAELIVDGHHCHDAAVLTALKLKGKDKLILVTDAMRGKCCQTENEIFDLGGQIVKVSQGAARLDNGVLAGSVLTMQQAVINMMQKTSVSLREIINMTSFNPAKILGIQQQTGSIASGKDADFVILDENLAVVMTVAQGNIIYKRLPN